MSFVHFVSVSVVAVDCWPPILFRVTRDGGVDAEAVVKEGAHDCMDALLSVRREDWGGRRLGGLLLRLLAVDGGCPVVRGVLWAFGRFVVEFLEGRLHLAWHGDVNVFFRIVPGEDEAKIFSSFPIDGALVCGADGVD